MKLIMGEENIEAFFEQARREQEMLLKSPIIRRRIELLVPGQWFINEPGDHGTGGEHWVLGKVCEEPDWDGVSFYAELYSIYTMGIGEVERVWSSHVSGLLIEGRAKFLIDHLGDEWKRAEASFTVNDYAPLAGVVVAETLVPVEDPHSWWRA